MYDLHQKTLLLVTGASRGLGRELAIRLACKLAPGSVVVLTARNQADLLRTSELIALVAPRDVRVLPLACDLAAADDLDLARIVGSGFDTDARFDAALIVHNSGSVGDPSRTALLHDSVDYIDKYFRLNMSGVVALNAIFVREAAVRVSRIGVVNISSLCALQPFKSMSLYCAGKAARDMFFRVLAAEHPEIRVLSYAPGPLVTDMSREIAKHSADADIKQTYTDGLSSGFLTCTVTVERLVGILERDTFESGAHVDFYDVLPDETKPEEQEIQVEKL